MVRWGMVRWKGKRKGKGEGEGGYKVCNVLFVRLGNIKIW